MMKRFAFGAFVALTAGVAQALAIYNGVAYPTEESEAKSETGVIGSYTLDVHPYVYCLRANGSSQGWLDSPFRNSALTLDGVLPFWSDSAAPSADKCYFIGATIGVRSISGNTTDYPDYNCAFKGKRVVIARGCSVSWKTHAPYYATFENEGIFFSYGSQLFNSTKTAGAYVNQKICGQVTFLGYTGSPATVICPSYHGSGTEPIANMANNTGFEFAGKVRGSNTTHVDVRPLSGNEWRGRIAFTGDTSAFQCILTVLSNDLCVAECGLKQNTSITLGNTATLKPEAASGNTVGVCNLFVSNGCSVVLSPTNTLYLAGKTEFQAGSKLYLDIPQKVPTKVVNFPVLKVASSVGITTDDIEVTGAYGGTFQSMTATTEGDLTIFSISLYPTSRTMAAADDRFVYELNTSVPYGESQMLASGAAYWSDGLAPHSDKMYFSDIGAGRSPMVVDGTTATTYTFDGGVYVQADGIQWKTGAPAVMSFPNGLVLLPKASIQITYGNPYYGQLDGPMTIGGTSGAPVTFLCTHSGSTGNDKSGFVLKGKLIGTKEAVLIASKSNSSDSYTGHFELEGDNSAYYGTIKAYDSTFVLGEKGAVHAKSVILSNSSFTTAGQGATVVVPFVSLANDSKLILNPADSLSLTSFEPGTQKITVNLDESTLGAAAIDRVLLNHVEGVDYTSLFDTVTLSSRVGQVAVDDEGNIRLTVKAVTALSTSTNNGDTTQPSMGKQTTSLETPSVWADSEAPHAGVDYTVPSGKFLSTVSSNANPPAYPKFLGDSLTLESGASFGLFQSTLEIDDFTMQSNTKFYFGNNGLKSVSGKLTLEETSAGGTVSFEAYYDVANGVNDIQLDITGPVGLKFAGTPYTSVPRGRMRLSGDNSGWTGKLTVTKQAIAEKGIPDWDKTTWLYVNDVKNLGGALTSFAADAVTLEAYGRLVVDGKVDFDTANRGVTVSGHGAIEVAEDCTFTVANTLTLNGELKAEGPGELKIAALDVTANSTITVESGSTVTVSALTKAEGVTLTKAGSGTLVLPAGTEYVRELAEGVTATITDTTCTISGSGTLTATATQALRSEGVTNLTLGEGVTGVEASAFSKFYGLQSVTFKSTDSVTVGDNAFLRCNSLERLVFEGAAPALSDKAFTLQTAIYMKDGLPTIYTIPQVTIQGYTQVLYGSNDLKTWTKITTEAQKAEYHFFKIALEQ